MIYVHHHLGLGDHIVCNAIVRNLYTKYKKLTLAVKKHNYESVRTLYADLDIQFHKVESDQDCINMYEKMSFIRIGFENCRSDWEKSFYDQVGIPYHKRFSDFFIKRDYVRENNLQKVVGAQGDFILMNCFSSDGKININLNSDKKIIEMKPITNNFFDWMSVIENCSELHTTITSLLPLIDQINFKKKVYIYKQKGRNYTPVNLNCEEIIYD